MCCRHGNFCWSIRKHKKKFVGCSSCSTESEFFAAFSCRRRCCCPSCDQKRALSARPSAHGGNPFLHSAPPMGIHHAQAFAHLFPVLFAHCLDRYLSTFCRARCHLARPKFITTHESLAGIIKQSNVSRNYCFPPAVHIQIGRAHV